MAASSPVSAVRHFNRFYTTQIGMLQKTYLKSRFSLTEVRTLYELAHRAGPPATTLVKVLGLDPGYLSRILTKFEKHGLIRRTPGADARQAHLSLTPKGRAAFLPLEHAADRGVRRMLERLEPARRQSLVESMRRIEGLLDPNPAGAAPYIIRTHQPGDMGWVIHRHGVLYAREYGWDERFEAEVAEIAARFIRHFDPRRERCWLAERDGSIVGSILLVRKSAAVGQLRLFLVEPSARRLGIGNRLVAECIRFGRQAGYRKITLWTQSVLTAARHLYNKHGFKIVHRERHASFGYRLTGETWELKL